MVKHVGLKDQFTENVGFKQPTPAYPIDVVGDINVTGAVRINGTAIVSGSSAPASGVTAVVAKSAAYTSTSADANTLFNFTTGSTFTFTLPSASSMSGKMLYFVKMDGAGVVTLSPPSGTIDGRTSINVYQESFAVFSDGTNYYSVNRQRGWIDVSTQTLAAATTWLYTGGPFTDTEIEAVEAKVSNLVLSAGTAVQLRIDSAGAVISTASYWWSTIGTNGTTATAANGQGVTFLALSGGVNYGVNANFRIDFNNLRATGANQINVEWKANLGGTNANTAVGSGTFSATSIDGFQLFNAGAATMAGVLRVRAFRT